MSDAFRFKGVSKLNAGEVTTGAPGSITGLTELKLYALEFFDDEGRKKRMVVMRLDDGTLCTPPNTVEWAMSLRPAPAWAAEKLAKIFEGRSTPIKVDTSVDVMGNDAGDV